MVVDPTMKCLSARKSKKLLIYTTIYMKLKEIVSEKTKLKISKEYTIWLYYTTFFR